MVTTKIYRNTTDHVIIIPGVSEEGIKPHDHISITTEYQPRVVLTNYPGLIDVEAEEAAGTIDSSADPRTWDEVFTPTQAAPAAPAEEQTNA